MVKFMKISGDKMTKSDLKSVQALQEVSQKMSLSRREKHLIGLAVTLTTGCTICTNRRFKDAINDGITKDELMELTDLVALTNAGVVARTAMTSWDENQELECNDGSCSIS